MLSSAKPAFSELYSAYAAGRLDPALALLLETQSMLRPDVRAALATSEAISGIMLETDAPAKLSSGARDRALALIEAFDPEVGGVRPAGVRPEPETALLSDLPRPLRQPALDAFGKTGFRAQGSGIRELALEIDSELDIAVYWGQPGVTIPRHTHGGSEFTLVLEGGFSDESGSFGPGDLVMKGPSDTHRPKIDAEGVCVTLVVRDAKLKFTGALGLIQRLLGR